MKSPVHLADDPSLSHRSYHHCLPPLQALLASKICSYAQGMNIIKAKSSEQKWNINLGGLARIWKVRLDCLSSPLAPPPCGFGYINWLCCT